MSRSTLYTRVYRAFTATYGFDMHNLYCLHTGKPIGWTHRTELEALVNLIGGDDPEEIADDIALRVLGSMRPSLHWNKFKNDSMVKLMEQQPVDTLAYLLNLLFSVVPSKDRMIAAHPGVNQLAGMVDRARDGLDVLKLNRSKIYVYQACKAWGVNDSTKTMLYILLELDAKWGLKFEWPPFSVTDFLEADSMELRLAMLENWYVKRLDDFENYLKKAEQQSNWTRKGNALAKPAFAKAFLQSKPPSKTAIRKAEKAAELDMMRGLLDEIMNGTNPDNAAATTPQPVVIRTSPISFGVK